MKGLHFPFISSPALSEPFSHVLNLSFHPCPVFTDLSKTEYGLPFLSLYTVLHVLTIPMQIKICHVLITVLYWLCPFSHFPLLSCHFTVLSYQFCPIPNLSCPFFAQSRSVLSFRLPVLIFSSPLLPVQTLSSPNYHILSCPFFNLFVISWLCSLPTSHLYVSNHLLQNLWYIMLTWSNFVEKS